MVQITLGVEDIDGRDGATRASQCDVICLQFTALLILSCQGMMRTKRLRTLSTRNTNLLKERKLVDRDISSIRNRTLKP